MEYKNILLGTNTFFPDWLTSINKINKPHIIIHDFVNTDIYNIIINKNIYYIIPLSDKDYNLISKIKIENGAKILYPTKKTQELLHNKNKFTQFMLDHFINYIPNIYYLNNIKLKDIAYPAISKPIYSTNGKNIFLIHNYHDFIEIKNKNNIQQFIDDVYEYSAYMLCDSGKIVTSRIIRYSYDKYNIKQNNFPKNYENVNHLNIEIFQNIINKLDYSGGLCIDFKVVHNRIYIFEINPRFGGSAFTCEFIYELLCI